VGDVDNFGLSGLFRDEQAGVLQLLFHGDWLCMPCSSLCVCARFRESIVGKKSMNQNSQLASRLVRTKVFRLGESQVCHADMNARWRRHFSGQGALACATKSVA
jgi:hypothetical protein